MVTLETDRVATSIYDLAAALLPKVTSASEHLARTSNPGLDLAAAIEEVVDALPLHDIETGFADLDPYLGEAILASALTCLRARYVTDPKDQRRMLRLGVERLRQALRDVCEESITSDTRPAGELVGWLVSDLDLSQHDVAELLGVSVRTLQRWLSPTNSSTPSGSEAARVRIVARLASHLRHTFTGPGVLRWFERPSPELAHHPPRDLLDDSSYYPALVRLAARARSSASS